ncbi:MAG: hypothetical protein ABI863_04175 [Ginsengibacter sp.]
MGLFEKTKFFYDGKQKIRAEIDGGTPYKKSDRWRDRYKKTDTYKYTGGQLTKWIPNSKLRRPNAVFGADPLLDLERQYGYMITAYRPPKSSASAEGEKVFTDLFEEIFKTNPKGNPKFFWNISPFSASDTNHSSIKSLINVPLRLYSDPDINWYIENRHVDFRDLNITDNASVINWLMSWGNKRAELITALGKGPYPFILRRVVQFGIR